MAIVSNAISMLNEESLSGIEMTSQNKMINFVRTLKHIVIRNNLFGHLQFIQNIMVKEIAYQIMLVTNLVNTV